MATAAADLKAQGTALLQKNDVVGALKMYQKGLQVSGLSKEDELALLLNTSLCYSKQGKHEKVVEASTKCLSIEPTHPKALFRRSKAYIALEKLTEAAMDAKNLQRYHPKSTAAIDLIKEITVIAKTSETGARKLTTDACKDGADVTLMKQLLHAVTEEESRARECASKGGVELLLSFATKNPLAFNVVGHLATYESTFPQTFQAIKRAYGDDKWLEELVKFSKNTEIPELNCAACLLILTKIAIRKEISNRNPLFVEALLDERAQVREVAVEACCNLYSETREDSELFVQDLKGIESLRVVCKEDPQLASLCLSRIVPILIKFDKTKDDLVAEKCTLLVAPAFAKNEDLSSIESLERVKGGLNALLALYNSSHDIAVEVVAPHAEMLGQLVTQAPDSLVVILSEILAQTGNSEKGRAILGTMSDMLHALLGHSNPHIRASASVALTKIEAVNFDSNSEQGAMVLGSVGHLFREGASIEELSKGVEAVSYVIADTDVKMMLATGKEGTRVLKALCDRARELKEAKAPNSDGDLGEPKKKKNDKEPEPKQLSDESVFGIAYLLQNVTMDEDEKKREKLREMEVTQEQWEQFEKITKQKSRPGNSRKDTPEEVALRVDSVIQAGGVSALRSVLFHKPTHTVASAVALGLRNLAAQSRVRGKIIAQGGISTLLKAHKIGWEQEQATKKTSYKGDPLCKDAAHALARLLISTDPRLLPNNQVFDALFPLIEQVRRSDEELVVFESLMAITNLEVVGEQVKDKVCSLRGLPAFEYAQFSEDLMVRRAATEAMSNLIPCEGILEWFASADKARLWVLFSEDWEERYETSRAATGGLAQVCDVPEIASRVRRFGGTDRLTQIVLEGCPYGEVVWRISVALQSLSQAEFKDTSEETKKETTQVSTEGGEGWTAELGPWTPRENDLVKKTFQYILKYRVSQADEGEQRAWGSAKQVAKEWLENAKSQ